MKLFRSLSSALIVLSAIVIGSPSFASDSKESVQRHQAPLGEPSSSLVSQLSRPDSCQFIPKTGARIDDSSCSITHSNNHGLITVQWSDGVVTQFEILNRVVPGHQGAALVDGAEAQYEPTMSGRLLFIITGNQNKIWLTFAN
jgi:hypothetical protein